MLYIGIKATENTVNVAYSLNDQEIKHIFNNTYEGFHTFFNDLIKRKSDVIIS